uniref:Solute carrier family 41 member n=1 Tax=Salarias fasciatus TaxID=181472 RepID=A0A672H2C9_SALFA
MHIKSCCTADRYLCSQNKCLCFSAQVSYYICAHTIRINNLIKQQYYLGKEEHFTHQNPDYLKTKYILLSFLKRSSTALSYRLSVRFSSIKPGLKVQLSCGISGLSFISLQVFFFFFFFGIIEVGDQQLRCIRWQVFREISQVFVLVPALVGLKGNLEMTLASRLLTAVSSHPNTDRTVTLHAYCRQQMDLGQVAALFTSSVTTAFIASLILGGVMVAVIMESRRLGVNPDNVATPIAASLGDLITLSLLAGVSSFSPLDVRCRPSNLLFLPAVVCGLFLLLIPVWVAVASLFPSIRQVLKSGWRPVILAMSISSVGGLILGTALSQLHFGAMAILTPIINGVGGNLVAIQASRMSTYLHFWSVPGALPATMSDPCPGPCSTFCSSNVNSRSARVLLGLVVPGHLLFLYAVQLLQGGHVSLTPPFVLCYLCAAQLQVLVLLYASGLMVPWLWRRGLDPDNFSIPYLTALGDLLQTHPDLLLFCLSTLNVLFSLCKRLNPPQSEKRNLNFT